MAKTPDEPAPKKAPKEANLRPPWKKGQSGNPAGRKKGSRNKLAEAFLSDALEAWDKRGKKALRDMAEDKPADFAKMIASIVPKEFDINATGSITTVSRIELVAPKADDDATG